MGTVNAHVVRTRSEKHAPHCCPDDIFTPKRAWPPAPCRAYDLRYPDRRIEHREEEYCEPWCDYDAHDEGEYDEYEVPCGSRSSVRGLQRGCGKRKRTYAVMVVVPGQLDDESNDGEERNVFWRWSCRICVLSVSRNCICWRSLRWCDRLGR